MQDLLYIVSIAIAKVIFIIVATIVGMDAYDRISGARLFRKLKICYAEKSSEHWNITLTDGEDVFYLNTSERDEKYAYLWLRNPTVLLQIRVSEQQVSKKLQDWLRSEAGISSQLVNLNSKVQG